jgi:hypothetical protein
MHGYLPIFTAPTHAILSLMRLNFLSVFSIHNQQTKNEKKYIPNRFTPFRVSTVNTKLRPNASGRIPVLYSEV